MSDARSLIRSYGHRIITFLLVALLAFGPAPLGGLVRADEIISVGAVADSHLRQAAPASNFGAAVAFSIQPNGAANRRAVMQFDPSSIPPSAAVKTSFLKLFMSGAPLASRTLAIHRLTPAGAWVENQVTWNVRATATNWTAAGGDFFANVASTQSTGTTSLVVLTWTLLGDSGVSNIPQGWVDGTLINRGIMIRDINENTGTGLATFGAKENATVARRPVFEVHYLRDVTVGAVTPDVSSIQVNFLFPPGATGANYQGALVAQQAGAVPPTFAPADGTTYSVGSQPVAGVTVVSNANNFVASPTNVLIADENGPDTIISPSTQYSYKIYTRDNNNIPGAATPAAPHYSFGGAATATTTTFAGGGTNKNWSYKTAGTALAPPGLDPGNVLIAGSNDFNVHSMSPVTGARNYRPAGAIGSTGGTIQSRPAVLSLGDNQIADCDSITVGLQPCTVTYVGSDDGRMYAFDAATGQQIWATPAPGAPGSLVAVGGIIQGGAAVQLKKYANVGFTHVTDLVFVGTRELSPTDSKVYALNGSTGAIVWTFAPNNMDAVNSTPAVDYANNVLWVTSLSNGASQPSLWKINSVTGAAIEDFSFGDISNSPTINNDGNVIYVLTDRGDLVTTRNDVAGCTKTFVTGAFSATGFPIVIGTGNLRDENVFFATTSPGAAQTVRKVRFKYNLFCGGETFANAAGYTRPTGIGTPSGLMFNPITQAAIYVSSSDGHIYKIDPATGAVLANRTVNLGITIGEPSFDVYLLKLYVGDAQGRVYSFDVF